MSKKLNDIVIPAAFTVAMIFLGVSLIINTSKSCDVSIDYKVTVDSFNNSSAPNIYEVKLACYKLCAEEFKNMNYLEQCMDKCEAIG